MSAKSREVVMNGPDDQFGVCLALDAFRIARGEQPKNFTYGEVKSWLDSLQPFYVGDELNYPEK